MTSVAMGINGRSWVEVRDLAAVSSALHRMDGGRFYSLVIWRLPPGMNFEDSNPSVESKEFLQCAGAADRMTVEVRRRDGEMLGHYCVGLKGSLSATEAERVPITWAEHRILVSPGEVFTADDAVPVFGSYIASGTVPPAHSLRPVVP
jgi:hypothetical protein